MNKKFLIIILITIVLIGLGLFAANTAGVFKNQNIQPENTQISDPNLSESELPGENLEIILFYSNGCAHCQILEQWIDENSIADKISFEAREIYSSEETFNLIFEKAEICSLDTSKGVSVPFLWTGTDCIIGDEPIEEFFQNKINSQSNEAGK